MGCKVREEPILPVPLPGVGSLPVGSWDSLDQWFSNSGLEPAVLAPPGNLLEMQPFILTPDLLN